MPPHDSEKKQYEPLFEDDWEFVKTPLADGWDKVGELTPQECIEAMLYNRLYELNPTKSRSQQMLDITLSVTKFSVDTIVIVVTGCCDITKVVLSVIDKALKVSGSALDFGVKVVTVIVNGILYVINGINDCLLNCQ